MKKILLSIIFMSLISCASNKAITIEDDSDDYDSETTIIPDVTDSFIGDYNPIKIENFIFLSKSSNNLKPKELNENYLIPRTNTVELSFRNGINLVTIILSKEERIKITEACNIFLTQYEDKTIPHHKINSSTAYLNSKCSLWFGIVSNGNGTDKNDYYINCEFIDKKPYLLLHFSPSRCDNNTEVFTPKISLYLSPSQVRDFITKISQENLNNHVKELQNKAYTY